MAYEFKPLNLAQLYQGADQAVASAMQMNLMALQASRMKQEFDEEDSLRSLAKRHTVTDESGATTMDLKSFTRGAYSVNPLKAIGFEKAASEAEKAGLEKQKLQGDIDEQRMKRAAEMLKHQNEASTVPYLKWKELTEGGMPDSDARAKVQPLYESALRNLVSSGLFNQEQLGKMKLLQSPQFDPTTAEAAMRFTLGAKESLAQYWNERNFGQKESQHADSLKVQIRGQDITLRGQNLTDERAREDLAQKGLEVKETEDGTFIVIDKKTRETVPVLGADGQPMRSLKGQGTDTERMSAGYATRMTAATKIVTELEKKGVGTPEWDEAMLGKVPVAGKALSNAFSSEQRQKYRQAQEDWVRAKLRKESGAVIADDEMDREIRTYFPQIGDSKGVIKQKAEARERADAGMIQNAGRAYKAPKAEAPKPPAEVQTFATEAEAAAAAAAGKIKSGDKIKIGNQPGTWQD